MKKNRQKMDVIQTHGAQFGRLTLLVGALVASGVLLTLTLPEAVAAPLPLPCGGCFNNSKVVVPFIQPGSNSVVSLTQSGNNLTITQQSQVAILNWQEFNIDKGYSVEFKQPNSTSSALNRIWSSDPSVIAGSLTANGQLYLVNQNGIVFANGAQVNAGTLIASSLDIQDQLFKDGFLTNTQIIPAFGDGVNGVHGFVRVDTGAVLNGSRIMLFAPVVENNGNIHTPDGQTVLAAGDRVYLEASQDPNLRGMLVEVDVNTPGAFDAQMQTNENNANNVLASLPGYVAYQNDPKTAKPASYLQSHSDGVVTNASTGNILTERGNITLIGYAVNQQGMVNATTSVTENGSIKLLARYNVAGGANDPNASTDSSQLFNQPHTTATGSSAYDIRATKTGVVTLESGSQTNIAPDKDTTTTTTDEQGFNPSIVEVMGNTINMKSGSSITAQDGRVTLVAIGNLDFATADPKTGVTPYLLIDAPGIDGYSTSYSSSFLNPNFVPSSNTGNSARVFLDSGSLIDVSGSKANVSVARDIITVQLRGTQLADDPLQSNGFLWGKNVQIDIRQGSTLANYASDEAQIGRAVDERTSAGGSVKLISTGDVVARSGSTINLSGGQVNYTGANIKTTSLISNGVVYNIANAPGNIIYDGIVGSYSVTHAKWGVTETVNTMAGGDTRGQWDPGYVEGKSAGTLTVLAPASVLNGDVVAKTVAGINQRNAYVFVDPTTMPSYMSTYQMMPNGGSLVIGNSNPAVDKTNNFTDYVNASNVTIHSGANSLPDSFTYNSALPTDLQSNIYLDSGKFGSANGINNLAVYSNGTVNVEAGTTIKLAPGGSITLSAEAVNMLGSIDAPSGTVNLGTAQTGTLAGTLLGTNNLYAGALTVGLANGSSTISTAGRWINESPQLGVPDRSVPLLINGGSINLSSGGDLQVAAGTTLNASGGAWLDSNNKLHGGSGGSITLANGGIMSGTTPFKMAMDGLDMQSYGTAGGKGGVLNIKAVDIQLGGSSQNPNVLVLQDTFFHNGGFSSYNLTAQGFDDPSSGALKVTAGTTIAPQMQSLILDRTASLQATGSDVNTFTTVGLLPDWQRPAASISLNAKNGSMLVDEGASIHVEPTASISLTAATQLTVLGTLQAAAGSINLNLNSTSQAYTSTQSIWLGANSQLLAQGYFQQAAPNSQGVIKGKVLDGGAINITTSGPINDPNSTSNSSGYVIAQQGSLMDVSGSSANIDLPQMVSGNLVYTRTHVAGNAGSIAIKSGEGVLLDGTMKAGVEAGSQAAAGSFTMTLHNNPGIVNPTDASYIGYLKTAANEAQIQISNGGSGSFATQFGLALSDTGAGITTLDALSGKASLDATALKTSGFDQIVLHSDKSIVLNNANLETRRSITLDAPVLVANGTAGKVNSAQVTLGNILGNQGLIDPLLVPAGSYSSVDGNGVLNVAAQQINLTGNFLISGVNQVNLNSSGDISLNGIYNQSTSNPALTGSLQTQGVLTLQANQVYPTTLSQFTISVQASASANNVSQINIKPVVSGKQVESPVMTAGGNLTLNAADIEQGGVLKAPMGQLTLNGTTKVALLEGSITSVSADGLIIPFGEIQSGNTWVYDVTGAGNFASIPAPPAKQLTINSQNVDIHNTATVNLSGGGDLYANEFFAGNGGTKNVTDPTKAAANTFAIIPGFSGFAPYDPQLVGQYAQPNSNTKLQVGASVYLAGGNGIAAGYYTLLPASYALLPGAYRVMAVSGYADLQPGQGASTLTDGSQIMAGKFAVVGTNIQDARYSGFEVSPGSVVRSQSELHDSFANTFFAAQAVTNGTQTSPLPIDAGQLVISATGSGATFKLDGTLAAAPGTGGQGALVDLNGPGFDIVNTVSSTPVYSADGTVALVQLTASSLSKLNANSLLIGGVRSQSASGIAINVGANEVRVDNAGSVLSSPEIILAANKAVTVKAGSDIEGSGNFSGQASNISISNHDQNNNSLTSDGALLRVSSSSQVGVTRANPATVPVATLTVENGATVGAIAGPAKDAQSSVLLDSSYITAIGNQSVLKGKSLSIAASNIDIGNQAASATSLDLSGALLAQALTFEDLTLHSYTDINFYGSGYLGGLDANQKQHILTNLVLNSRSLNGINNAGAENKIDATNVTLMNDNTGTSSVAGYGAGNLSINADQITLAKGNIAIQGFDQVTVAAANKIMAQGTSTITVNAGDAGLNNHNLLLQTAQITGANNSNLTITAGTNSNELVSILPGTGAKPVAEALNAKLTIIGKRILDNGNIDLPSGLVTLHATGTEAADGVTLGTGAVIAANGISKTISGQTVYARAGTVSITADNGGVDIQNGSLVDVSGAKSITADGVGGDAGTINIAAGNGTFSVAGKLNGAAASSNVQGSFALDAKSVAGSLDALNATLMAGGFNQSINIRDRSDTQLNLTTKVKAQNYQLAVDSGNIDVSGTIDASGASGGNIQLAAGNNVTLESSALLDAHATLKDSGNAGGKVTVETSNGNINLMTGSYIDVSGATTSGTASAGASGKVMLRAPLINGNTDVAVNTLAGTSINVSAGADLTVEAYRSYNLAVVGGTATLTGTNVNIHDPSKASDALNSQYFNDAANFTTNYAYAIKSRLGMSQNQHLTPGIELDSAGDLKLAANWDLSQWRFNNGNSLVPTLSNNIEPGILTLKAAGNLIFGTPGGTTAANTVAGLPKYSASPASLTDGFTVTDLSGKLVTNNIYAVSSKGVNQQVIKPMTTDSWSYRLVAGGDSSSADVMGTVQSKGNVELAAGAEFVGTTTATKTNNYTAMEQISTGTGFINIAAGGNLILDNRDSVIYTAGQAAPNIPILNGIPTSGSSGPNTYFGYNGGDINISVKGDVIGAATNQLVTDWQWRPVLTTATASNYQPAWWINLASFRENIGALGGGNVSVNAGGNINQLSVMLPSTGYVDSNNQVQVLGGGNLNITAAGNINSGVFYVGNGQGTIQAGGSLGSSITGLNKAPFYTLLALGQGNFDVSSGGDLTLQGVLNPTVLPYGYSELPGTSNIGKTLSYFFTYGDTSGVELTSVGGNISTFTGISMSQSAATSASGVFNYSNQSGVNLSLFNYYPGSLSDIALVGNIIFNNSMFPSANGNLKLVAAGNISASTVYMSDAAPSGLQANTPVTDEKALNIILQSQYSSVHQNDMQPVILAAGGSITSGSLQLPKAALIQAGQDVSNVNFKVQNLNSADTTSIVAGRDITNDTAVIYGPGQFVMQAGRNVDLGSNNGIETEGNTHNFLLPPQSASVTVLAGVGQGEMDTQAFIAKYINPATGSSYVTDLATYIGKNIDPSTKTGQANIAYLVSYLFDPSTLSGQANSLALNSFVLANGASPNLTPSQQYSYFKTLPVATQTTFAFNNFKTQNTKIQENYIASAPVQGLMPDLISFVNDHGGNVGTTADAYAAFNKLPTSLQTAFVDQVFFNELKQSGRSAVTSGNYQSGYDAIATLFPTDSSKPNGGYQGDIDLYYSQIKTDHGGDINLFAPGGSVNAGLANVYTQITKAPSQLGIVTVDGGGVNAFVNNDFLVNQSRVFTLQGGSILMWSSEGNIDAGKGSKTASATPPPQLVVNAKDGTFTLDATGSIVGSGIRVLQANPNTVPGDVDLIAPVGTVNAGDAGIGSAGNITIAALHVVGADNINFGGTSAGVPVAAPAPVSVGLGNLTDASKAADQATQSLGNMNDMNPNDFKPTFLSVEVIGLGEQDSGSNKDKDKSTDM